MFSRRNQETEASLSRVKAELEARRRLIRDHLDSTSVLDPAETLEADRRRRLRRGLSLLFGGQVDTPQAAAH